MALLSQRATRSEEAKFESINLKNPIILMHIAPRNQYGDLMVASKKKPLRPHLMSNLKPVTSIT